MLELWCRVCVGQLGPLCFSSLMPVRAANTGARQCPGLSPWSPATPLISALCCWARMCGSQVQSLPFPLNIFSMDSRNKMSPSKIGLSVHSQVLTHDIVFSDSNVATPLLSFLSSLKCVLCFSSQCHPLNACVFFHVCVLSFTPPHFSVNSPKAGIWSSCTSCFSELRDT